MGKRKQECPRKLAETGSELSKLENIIKRLRTNPPPVNADTTELPSPTPAPVAPALAPRQSTPVEPDDHLKHVGHSVNEVQPLDLRLPPRIPTHNQNMTVPLSRHMAHHSSSDPVVGVAPTALDLSRTLSPNVKNTSNTSNALPVSLGRSIMQQPTGSSAATSFQELSAKLEQYFSTGIAASKFPRKMVRGQDMWMQDVEQKRRILKCLKCGCSYNTLAELARHIKKSGHHSSDAAALSVLASPSSVPVHVQSSRNMSVTMDTRHDFQSRLDMVASGRPAATFSHNVTGSIRQNRANEREKISRGPSAFRPVQQQQHIDKPIRSMEIMKTIPSQRISADGTMLASAQRNFQPDRQTNHASGGSMRRDQSTRDRRVMANEAGKIFDGVGHNGFFHGVSSEPLRNHYASKNWSDMSARPSTNSASTSTRTSLNIRLQPHNESRISLTQSPTTTSRDAAAEVCQPLARGIAAESEPAVTLKAERKADVCPEEEPKRMVKSEPKEEVKVPSPGPPNYSVETSPLFALKNFLDFGIPRLKPTGIDGGRI